MILQIIVKGATMDYIRLDSLLSDPPRWVLLPILRDYRPKLDDACVILFSSGTTGVQKAVLLSHRCVIHQSFILLWVTFTHNSLLKKYELCILKSFWFFVVHANRNSPKTSLSRRYTPCIKLQANLVYNSCISS